MFRRRSRSSSTQTISRSPGAAPGSALPAGAVATAGPGLAAELAAAGWVLPRGLARGGDPAWTLTGTVASTHATPVDPAGLVSAEGWSLDWWVGADDRWHVPAREASVRQQALDAAPVIETAVRGPGGDAVHRAYGVRSPRPVGDEWAVVEIENRTAIPFAVALVVRPFATGGVGSASSITLEPVDGGRGRDVAHLVRVDGRPAVVLPRRPARLAAGSRADGDVIEVVTDGAAGADLVAATCPDGLATLAMVFPLPHTAVLRVAMPVGEAGDGALGYPEVIPDGATVASGWEVHRRGPRIEVPEPRLAGAVEQARAQIQLAHDGAAVRRDGVAAVDLEPGATEVLLGAFDLLDRPADVGTVVARWHDRLADPEPAVDALVVDVVARHWLLHRVDALLDWMLPEVAAAVERLDRADRRNRLDDPVDRWRASHALFAGARMLGSAGQPDAAESVGVLARRLAVGSAAPSTTVADRLVALAADLAAIGSDGRLDAGDPSPDEDALVARLAAELETVAPTGAWPGTGAGGRAVGHDLAASAALVHVARNLLVVEERDGLVLLPVHPDGWYGGGIELHDAPTAHGRLSYAVRWHGIRPALLWELEPHDGAGPVRLRIPGLDPAWITTETKGDALLGPVSPPAGLSSIQIVAEHPDIDPEMRRPGTAPTDPGPPPPDSGSFS